MKNKLTLLLFTVFMGAIMAFFIKLSWPQDEFSKYGDNAKSMHLMQRASEGGELSNEDWSYLKSRIKSQDINNIDAALSAAMETHDPVQKAELSDIAYNLALFDVSEPSGLVRGKALVTLYRLHDARVGQLMTEFKNDQRELVKFAILIIKSR